MIERHEKMKTAQFFKNILQNFSKGTMEEQENYEGTI